MRGPDSEQVLAVTRLAVMRTRNPKVGNTVETLLRVSTVANAERDFALKVYAEEGNRGLVGNDAQESR